MIERAQREITHPSSVACAARPDLRLAARHIAPLAGRQRGLLPITRVNNLLGTYSVT
jgi:hypothetical protein